MSSEDTKILEFTQQQKYDKRPFVIYAGLECLIEKIDGCKSNPENSFTIKVGEHIPSRVSMSATSSCKSKKNKHDTYRSKGCMKKFCESLRKHTLKILILKRRK